jgi:hypothetical protein
MSGGDTIQTDDSAAGYKTQVVKVSYGADGAAPTRVVAGTGLPVQQQDYTTTANITTQNLVPTGTATAGSVCQTAALNGACQVAIQVTGTYTGTLTPQGTVDGATWQTLGSSTALQVNSNGSFQGSITSATQGVFFANVAGFSKFRISANGAVTGTAVVTLQVSNGSGQIPSTITVGNNPTVTGPQAKAGIAANGFPQLTLGATALPTAVTNGQLVMPMADKLGRTVVVHNAMRDLVTPVTQLVLTASTAETTLVGATASTFHDLLEVTFCNSSLTTATQVDIRDSTGGTVRCSVFVPAGSTVVKAWHTPLPQATVNTNWTAQCGSSVSSLTITGSYVSNN